LRITASDIKTKELTMAEIKIEKKTSIWIWILLGTAIIGAFIYYLSSREQTNEMEEIPKPVDLIDVNENNATVNAFVIFIESDTNKITLDHKFTSEALIKLTDATNAMAAEIGYDIKADMEKVKGYADFLTRDVMNTLHADSIRKSFDILTNVLQNIQQAKYPALNIEVAELREASVAVKPDILTLDQKDEVKNFFKKASILLKKMN
jgi:hypothetical protein